MNLYFTVLSGMAIQDVIVVHPIEADHHPISALLDNVRAFLKS